MYFVMTVTVDELKVVEQVVVSIPIGMMNLHNVTGHEVESTTLAASLLAVEQLDHPF